MPSIVLSDFKDNLNDICRPNRFVVSITSESSVINNMFDDDDYYFVKACSIPGKTMGEIDVNWAGYKYKLAGDPTFNDVVITFYNEITRDGSETIRDRFLEWLNIMSNDESNDRAIHTDYKCSVWIKQLDGKGNVVSVYQLIFAHPKDISEIPLSMETTDALEEFTVAFSYSFFKSGADISGERAGNEDIQEVNSAPFGGTSF